MRLTIVKDDNIIIKDNRPISVNLSTLPEDFHALQWLNDSGHIEFKTRNKANQEISDLTPYQNLIDLYDQEKKRLDDEEAKRVQDRLDYEASVDYLRKLRDDKIEEDIWYFERHKMQQELSIPTTLTDQQYLAYLDYIQALRDITNVYQSAATVEWPLKPSFMN